MILSLEDAGKTEVKLYGPPGLKKYLASTRFFMRTFNVGCCVGCFSLFDEYLFVCRLRCTNSTWTLLPKIRL
jgi:hypothetical protein